MAEERLFGRLLDLHARNVGRVPEEDFFTELVAYVFETSPEVLLAWLKELGWAGPQKYASIRVETQKVHSSLPGHALASIPDIRIDLFADGVRDLIFIESKLGSEEHDNQLQRYAEILHHDLGSNQKGLIFVTRLAEKKDTNVIFANMPDSSVQFIQGRWKQFYNFLAKWPKQFLVDEILRFMEENGMDDRQITFTENDLITMSSLSRSFLLMTSVLDRSLQRQFESTVGSRPRFTPNEFLAESWARFALEGELVAGAMQCALGFDALAPGAGDPQLFIMMQVFPEHTYGENTALRERLIQLMKAVQAEQPAWVGYGLDDRQTYSLVKKSFPLRDLLQSDQIVDTCNAVLEGYLAELAEIMKRSPQIPWKLSIRIN